MKTWKKVLIIIIMCTVGRLITDIFSMTDHGWIYITGWVAGCWAVTFTEFR